MTGAAKTSSPQTGGQDRVENTDLSLRQAEKLVREHGDDLEKLMTIAAIMKAEG